MGSGCSTTPKILGLSENDFDDLRVQRLVAPYCPHSVLKFLSNKTLTEPISTTVMGACLLADICGFTKFSGELCTEGGTGIDKLRIVTSTFLTKFIETVYLYFGDGMFIHSPTHSSLLHSHCLRW
jgi:hypothetical protein